MSTEAAVILKEVVSAKATKYAAFVDYKESDAHWLPKIPSHWQMKRLRFAVEFPKKSETRNLASVTQVSFVPMEAIGEYGGLDLTEKKPLEDVVNGFTYFAEGDVIVAKITPCFENGKGAIASGLENGIGFGTTELYVLRATSEVDRKYLFYLTIGDDFRKLGAGEMYGAGGQKRVPEEFIRELRHPLPPLSEQRAIASFLDARTAKIDALIKKKVRLIELLQEKRTALISHAVTKGLNPATPLKDSGIDWLGQIPEHWTLTRIGRLCEVGNGSTPRRDTQEYWYDGDYPWLNSTRINDRVITAAEQFVTPFALKECHLPIIRPNSVLMAITGEGQTRGRAALLQVEATINQHLAYLTPRNRRLRSDFLVNCLHAQYKWLRLASSGVGSTRAALTCEYIKSIPIAVPPPDEQITIVKTLDQETAKLDALIAKVTLAIERLREYRTALISAAVTGKIDVRGHVEGGK